jgi:hypothetical protein
MANNDLPANISIDDLQEEWKEASAENNPQGKESTFNAKNYLDVRLGDGEKEKKLTIRLLPMDPNGGSPFVHVHFHNVEVHKDLVKQGQKPYKSFVCLNSKKNPGINHEVFGDKCPFCETNWDAYQKSLTQGISAVEKKKWQDTSLAYKTKEAIIVRCIERGKEDEGVKFWKFNIKFDNTDPYHKILSIAKTRADEGKAVGQEINILDLYNGRDLNLTIKKGNTDNQTSIEIIESGVNTPVTKDPELLKKWLNDSKKWQDVFTAKPYDYLELILEGKYPWFDRELNKWVDRDDYNARHGIAQSQQEADADKKIDEAKQKLNTTSSIATEATQVIEDVPSNDDDENDIPF